MAATDIQGTGEVVKAPLQCGLLIKRQRCLQRLLSFGRQAVLGRGQGDGGGAHMTDTLQYVP